MYMGHIRPIQALYTYIYGSHIYVGCLYLVVNMHHVLCIYHFGMLQAYRLTSQYAEATNTQKYNIIFSCSYVYSPMFEVCLSCTPSSSVFISQTASQFLLGFVLVGFYTRSAEPRTSISRVGGDPLHGSPPTRLMLVLGSARAGKF